MGSFECRPALTLQLAVSTGIPLAALPAATRHQLRADWGAILQATDTRVSRQRVTTTNASWRLWTAFCNTLHVDPYGLPRDAIPLLQLFAQRIRDGTIAPGRRAVRSRTVEDAVRAVGQTYAGLGSVDPRLNAHGTLDLRLTSLFQSWSKYDDPPSRVKPLPGTLLAITVALARQEATPVALAVASLLTLGHFFLLRPGEYMGAPDDSLDTLFRLRDLTLWVGSRSLDHLHCPIPDLQAATFATLTFTRQKNGVRNETVGHGRSGHPHLCPVLCLVDRVIYLRSIHADPATPLNAYGARPRCFIRPGDITRRIRVALSLHPHPGYSATDVSARSTRAGGAMALLCAGVGRERIRMIGRWRSDELYRYLHVQAQPVMNGLAAAMLRGSSYQMAPG